MAATCDSICFCNVVFKYRMATALELLNSPHERCCFGSDCVGESMDGMTLREFVERVQWPGADEELFAAIMDLFALNKIKVHACPFLRQVCRVGCAFVWAGSR